ncbi:hypothetical protein A3J17_02850 [Candidatus Curtissbacteria bacterium RIFCSPLOWO2_02_FULL_40_11]|uniref:Cation-transporting P-type ATPase N-terminal domain-containing protein n=1 Tax=Candidatus Curtissbacteria bacterium RIFCSPLOWO2_12_FULL_38_9 TaxID=1797735 RepID=A0A1F5ICE7_9BACT|nr:MAG: hypothetical protein A3J17_02850 [Candidatus Curtissbacteria bacterium RIFCSPLOWO2_02_FULL_40_11]OGE14068.1 MAG: hypothetical protein A3G14_04800 [Candidatus Curtissbacteria bacterium RIFCSPLOWO2_12_FULL_38_9]
MKWYQKSAKEALEEWTVKQENGLDYDDAARRLKTYGANELARHKEETIFDIFISQFKSPLIYILIFAALLVLVLGENVDAIVILTVIVVNAIVGTIQEGKAKNSLERLRNLTRHKTLVRRDGEEDLISSEHVVPGDILILKEGDRVTADARIISAEFLKVDESILTGEAYAVGKKSEVIREENLVLGDQKNMVFSGTSVVSGYCEAVVVTTGFDSELGKISKEVLESSDLPLPLANKINKLTHFIAFAVFGVAFITLILGLLRGIEFIEIVSAVIGLAVSIVPEGLPIAVTIVLAGGIWRMAKEKAIIRQLAGVEALGNADALLVDKTGTITTGQMVIKQVNLDGKLIEVTGEGYEPKGKIKITNSKQKAKLEKLLGLCLLSLKANVVHTEHTGWKPSGDPTEAAIATLCLKAGLNREKLSKEYKTDFARPFDSKKRYIEAAFAKEGEKWHVLVGAPEFLSKKLKIDHDLEKDYHKFAQKGLRVVGLAVFGPKKKLFGHALLTIEEETRKSVPSSVEEAKRAGFRVVMMTGDYAETAKAIAKKVGIYEEGDTVLTGEDVEKLAEVELEERIEKVSVFARITPEHKLKIVNAFKKKGHVCAMTGDGVNDAPALQAANLGIGLGSGTQVAKDSSDIVLVDDNFSTIVDAIREGRAIYISLKENILYLFSTGFGEVLVISGAILIGLPLPLVAVQIIWLNFVTDGFLVVGLAQDSPTKRQLKSKEDVNSDNLIDKLMIRRIMLMGGVMLLITLPVFNYYKASYSLEYARTMALLVLSAVQWFNALNVRSRTRSVFTIPLNNNFLNAAFVIVLILQFVAIETTFGNKILHTVDINIGQWVIGIALATSIIWVEEIRKYFVRKAGKLDTSTAKVPAGRLAIDSGG